LKHEEAEFTKNLNHLLAVDRADSIENEGKNLFNSTEAFKRSLNKLEAMVGAQEVSKMTPDEKKKELAQLRAGQQRANKQYEEILNGVNEFRTNLNALQAEVKKLKKDN